MHFEPIPGTLGIVKLHYEQNAPSRPQQLNFSKNANFLPSILFETAARHTLTTSVPSHPSAKVKHACPKLNAISAVCPPCVTSATLKQFHPIYRHVRRKPGNQPDIDRSTRALDHLASSEIEQLLSPNVSDLIGAISIVAQQQMFDAQEDARFAAVLLARTH